MTCVQEWIPPGSGAAGSGDGAVLARLLRVPGETYSVERLRRLLHQRVVCPHEPERAEGERARVGVLLDPVRGIRLDAFPFAERDERVEERRSTQVRPGLELLLVETVDEAAERLEIAAREREHQSRWIEVHAVSLHADPLGLPLEATRLAVGAVERGRHGGKEQRLDVQWTGGHEVRFDRVLGLWKELLHVAPAAEQRLETDPTADHMQPVVRGQPC